MAYTPESLVIREALLEKARKQHFNGICLGLNLSGSVLFAHNVHKNTF